MFAELKIKKYIIIIYLCADSFVYREPRRERQHKLPFSSSTGCGSRAYIYFTVNKRSVQSEFYFVGP